MSDAPRPELAVFRDLLTSTGGNLTYAGRFDASFNLETSPTDEVSISLQDDEGLFITLFLYPEETLAMASKAEMGATIAGWLRDVANKLDPAGEVRFADMTEADLQEEIGLRLVEAGSIFAQLRDDEAQGFSRGESWRVRARDAERHLRREIAIFKAEWARRLVARNGVLPGALADVGPSREQMHRAHVEASQADAEKRRLERAARNEANERRQRGQDALFAMTVRQILGREETTRLWDEARRRFPDQECWNSLRRDDPPPEPFVSIGDAVAGVVERTAEMANEEVS